jgi:arylsulfatase A-like enzyme
MSRIARAAPETPPAPPRRFARTLVILLVAGVFLGTAAAIAQLRLLRFGSIAADQLALFWGFFVGSGALLAAGFGAILWFALGGRPARHAAALAAGAIVPIAFFGLLLPRNARPLPHVFLFVTDATRADHLSLYGYERDTTPFLKGKRKSSVVFRNMVAQGSHTIVTTPCILASCYPSEHGLVDYDYVLSPHFTLISEYLHDKGYSTYACVANPHLGPVNGFNQGFDVYEYGEEWTSPPASLLNERLLKWIDEEGRAPMFGFLFYTDPHNPYLSNSTFERLFDPEWPGEPVSDWYQGPNNKPEPRTLFNLIAQYDGAIAYWDSEFRNLSEALERRGILENALTVYTADHGEEFWDHGTWGHNHNLYEESIRVPLVMSFPPPVRFPPLPRTSRFVNDVVSSVDIVPTVLDYLRFRPDPNVRGASLVPIAMGRKDDGPERQAYCELILRRFGSYDIRALRTLQHKYIMNFNIQGNRNRGDEFYNLHTDPLERTNALESLPNEAEAHREMLAALIQEISKRAPARVDTVEISEATKERLRALGYIGE